MNVTVSIPDKLAKYLAQSADLSREMLEALALESYRRETLSLGQIAELLDLSIDEANAFLKKHQVPLNYTFDDMKDDEQVIAKLNGHRNLQETLSADEWITSLKNWASQRPDVPDLSEEALRRENLYDDRI